LYLLISVNESNVCESVEIIPTEKSAK